MAHRDAAGGSRPHHQVAEVSTNIGYLSAMMTTSKSIYRGYRFPAEVIQQAVWLYFRKRLAEGV